MIPKDEQLTGSASADLRDLYIGQNVAPADGASAEAAPAVIIPDSDPDELTEWHGTTLSGDKWSIYQGQASEVLSRLPAESVHCVVTSPPYFWLRDYGVDGQIGLEETVDEYIAAI
ncbi:MAG: hypothetical protein M0Z27_07710, partial [Thermaerobacter sp.]|nr:hypothetical protein [Thermaerobacter sp.]